MQKLHDEQHSLSGMTFVQILKEFPVKDVLSDEVRRNKLLVFLLRRGYIDEKYANYINYFITTLFVYQRKEVDLHDLLVEHSDLCEIGGFWPLGCC